MYNYDSVTDLFKNLSDPNRLRVLLLLRKRPVCVCEFDNILKISLSTISTHLKLLKASGLIRSKKDGRWVIYELADNSSLEKILADLELSLKDDYQYNEDMKRISEITRDNCTNQQKR
ncbi:transcriptional regulator, ArsR family [Denitrovibrio acetiphilus DSM 12809]|jgi:ArsR family transcriptional regulator|uniref:Transcriptional regulator, ArsR family n=1 Tax=Denitrovibrio acetiphilus (strain DSM 12809 / NBRC 114555 / N2460) TaxID=522772 RepID=D4H288_DENA2|nr:metalloregulator ArsR/SmtB family transcription factor [Denitrovibrio acetiphilus]ADD68879.1 transcriptional regulator, ArsR family [Denitrovibrio acetiphilus DSM 12809]